MTTPSPTPLPDVAEVSRLAQTILQSVGSVVVGKQEPLGLVLAGILAGGHVLLEDYPGLGKTLAARSFAQTLGLVFKRVQFTPDLLPGDITGSYVFDQKRVEFDFRQGPVFAGLLLADEINRAPPKTQAALLEAMQERQVTVEGQTFELPHPFHVLATANPVEYEGTYPLPEAQLDRFLMRIGFGYPSLDDEWEILRARIARQREETELAPVVSGPQLRAMQQAVETVTVDESIGRYCVELTAATRVHADALMGASPRGSLGLMLVGRAHAVIDGRDYVTPEDIKAVAVPVLGHRITVRPEMWMSNVTGAAIVNQALRSVPAPAPVELRREP